MSNDTESFRRYENTGEKIAVRTRSISLYSLRSPNNFYLETEISSAKKIVCVCVVSACVYGTAVNKRGGNAISTSVVCVRDRVLRTKIHRY